MDQELVRASLAGDLIEVRRLLSRGSNPNTERMYRTPLNFAAEMNRVSVVRELLLNGADVTITDKQGETPLHIASQSGHANVVKELLLNGADPNTLNNYDHNSLYYTIVNRNNQHFPEYIRDGCAEIVEILETYFPSLQALAMRSIRRNRIDITKIPPNLYSS